MADPPSSAIKMRNPPRRMRSYIAVQSGVGLD
jgi:hypothetical protein